MPQPVIAIITGGVDIAEHDAAAHLDAVHLGEADIAEHDVGTRLEDERHAVGPVRATRTACPSCSSHVDIISAASSLSSTTTMLSGDAGFDDGAPVAVRLHRRSLSRPGRDRRA